MIVGLGLGAVMAAVLEISVMVWVAERIGASNTVLLLIVLSAVGAWIVKREGLSVLRRLRENVRDGRIPPNAVVDGAMILVAGVLLLPPGFVTGLLGLVLILPPVRRVVGRMAADAIRVRAARRIPMTRRPNTSTTGNGDWGTRWQRQGPASKTRSTGSEIIDLDGEEIDLSDPSVELGPVTSD